MPRESFDKIDEEYFNTILDENFDFKGEIKFDFPAIIKGKVEGKIFSKDKLVIGPNAIIKADITARSLDCFGKIEGKVNIEEDAYFHSPATLTGSLKTAFLTFEKGCIMNGIIEMKNNGN